MERRQPTIIGYWKYALICAKQIKLFPKTHRTNVYIMGEGDVISILSNDRKQSIANIFSATRGKKFGQWDQEEKVLFPSTN